MKITCNRFKLVSVDPFDRIVTLSTDANISVEHFLIPDKHANYLFLFTVNLVSYVSGNGRLKRHIYHIQTRSRLAKSIYQIGNRGSLWGKNLIYY